MERRLLNQGWLMRWEDEKLSCSVPCSVVSTLLHHQRIEDPYRKGNEAKIQPLFEKDYLFEKAFTLSKEDLRSRRILLGFDTLDTLCEIYLNGNKIAEEKIEEFVPGIIRDQTNIFDEYRTNFQNHFFHYLEKDIFDDTKKLLNNSFLFVESKSAKLLNYTQIELEDLSYNLDNSNYVESYKKVNNILEDLLTNFASLKSFQQERIKPKFIDEEIENKKIDKEIDKLIIKMMKKIKFCEALIKMIKNQKKESNTILEKVKYNIKTYLVSKIQNFLNEFRKNQQQYLQNLKEMGVMINMNNDNINSSDKLINNNDDERKNFLYTQEDDKHIQIRKRDEDISVLVKSIDELSGIFKDLDRKSVV